VGWRPPGSRRHACRARCIRRTVGKRSAREPQAQFERSELETGCVSGTASVLPVAKKDRKTSPEAHLQALFDAGDWRAARAEASRMRLPSGEADPFAAAVERRMRPDESAAWAAGLGGLLFAAVAALGLFLKWR